MKAALPNWLDQIREANARFCERMSLEKMPVERTPCPYAIITCMDPRVNLECIGIPTFTSDGEARSHIRIIRTIGGMIERRSLVVGVFLAGIRELAIVMHSDCGCCLAYSKIDTIIDNMRKNLSEQRFEAFRSEIGEPFENRLASWFKVFRDPKEAVRQEAEYVRSLAVVPETLVVHGIIYELSSAKIDIVVNGYD